MRLKSFAILHHLRVMANWVSFIWNSTALMDDGWNIQQIVRSNGLLLMIAAF
jgi:hypothetical protein